MIQSVRRHFSVIFLAVLAYVPLLLSAPGRLPADTKLYLYLDPARLLSDAAWTWDVRQLGGWVPHQNVGYLWPTGPWFAFFDWLGIPDWIAHRLWLGTVLLIAGLGVRWLTKLLELPPSTFVVAALAYQLSPYILPYISRTSALLLPWALLPWIVGLTLLIVRERRWQYFAVFGLLIMSSGGLNATALLMIAPAPVVWLIDAWSRREISGRRFASIVAILTVISGVMSAWWLAGLSVQGKYGAPVLSYSEALQSTSATSTAVETLRGLGYWLFYDRNAVTALTSASTPYQNNFVVIVAGLLVIIFGLIGLASHARLKRPLSLMLLLGVVLSVGAYPSNSPSPLWSYFASHPKNALSLALRSSSRAVPLVSLALAIGLAIFVQQARTFLSSSNSTSLVVRRAKNLEFLALPVALLLIGLNLPALFGGRLIDPAISRPEKLPAAWTQTAALLDARYDEGHTGSVLILPGIESAAYRWGYPVDPILPGITKKPLITRDWLPLGSAPFMDLLYALDDSFQNGTADPDSIAPIARLLGADTVMVVNSYQYERFGVNRPERSSSLIDTAPGLERIAQFGEPTINLAPDGTTPAADDLVDFPPAPLPEIVLYAVQNSNPGARVTNAPLVVSADGTGLVDLAAMDMIDGTSTVLASAALHDETSSEKLLLESLTVAPELIVTDSNRKRAHHWRSSQEVWGATEGSTGPLETFDAFDNRLPVFASSSQEFDTQTIVEDNAGITMSATAYGALLSYLPEYRPGNANDDDLDTSWSVGWGVDPVGQVLTISSPTSAIDQLVLVPAGYPEQRRRVESFSVSIDGSSWRSYEAARGLANTTIDFEQSGNVVKVRIDQVSAGDASDPVGWAEVLPISHRRPEIIVVPSDASSVAPASTPVSFAFTRLRSDPYDRRRQDPELSIRRSFLVGHTDQYLVTADGTVVESRADDQSDRSTCRDDLIDIDGIGIPVRIENLSAGRVTISSCGPSTVTAGRRLLATTSSSDIAIDHVVLRSVRANRATPSTVIPLESSRTQRSSIVPACSNPCWIELADGANFGWSASLAGRSLSAPMASAGGRLLWSIAPSAETRSFSARWTPQIRLWVGLGVTVLGLVLSLVVLSTSRLRRRSSTSLDRIRSSSEPESSPLGPISVVGLALAAGFILISPFFGILAAVITALCGRRNRLLGTVGLILTGLGLLFVVAQLIRTGAQPGFGWPSVFHRAHRPTLLGILLVALAPWNRSPSEVENTPLSTASVSDS